MENYMNNQDLLVNMKKIKSNLKTVITELNNVQNILNQSITFDNVGFKSKEIKNITDKIDIQIKEIDKKMISKLDG